MQFNAKMVGAGVAAAVAAGVGYTLLNLRDEGLVFDTDVRDGAFSVRRYSQLLVAETVEPGTRDSALARGFAAIADFLDRRAGGRPVPLSAPLLADGDDDGRGWRARYVVPQSLRSSTFEGEEAGVRVRLIQPRRLAAVRFAGTVDDRALTRHEDNLRDWMDGHGYRAEGPVEHAFYGTPLAPSRFRRSDVLIPLAA